MAYIIVEEAILSMPAAASEVDMSQEAMVVVSVVATVAAQDITVVAMAAIMATQAPATMAVAGITAAMVVTAVIMEEIMAIAPITEVGALDWDWA